MYEKDYFMRLIQALVDAIKKIIHTIDKEDFKNAKQQIDQSYDLLGNTVSFFKTAHLDEIVSFFKTKDGDFLKRIDLLAELLFLEARIEAQLDARSQLLNKSKHLLEYSVCLSKEYSFERNNTLLKIKNELNNSSYGK